MHHTKNIALCDFHAHIKRDINYGKGDAYVSLGHHISGIALIAAALGFGGLAGTAAGALKLSLSSGLFCSW